MTNTTFVCSQRATQKEISEIRLQVFTLGNRLNNYRINNAVRVRAALGDLLLASIRREAELTALLSFLNTTCRILNKKPITPHCEVITSDLDDAVGNIIGFKNDGKGFAIIPTFRELGAVFVPTQYKVTLLRNTDFEKLYIVMLNDELKADFLGRQQLVQEHNALVLRHTHLMCLLA
jgi:hypothetical protein